MRDSSQYLGQNLNWWAAVRLGDDEQHGFRFESFSVTGGVEKVHLITGHLPLITFTYCLPEECINFIGKFTFPSSVNISKYFATWKFTRHLHFIIRPPPLSLE